MSKEKKKYNCKKGRHPYDKRYIPSKGKKYYVCVWCGHYKPVESEDE